MMNGHSIAVVIPLYNGERFIERALESVLNQSHSPDEIIVVDDGSTDGGPAIVERLAAVHPIKLIQKKNGGQSSARNLGVKASRSSLIALLDQDDLWYSNHLIELIKPFRSHGSSSLGWSYSNLDEGDEHGLLLTRSFLNTRRAMHPKVSLLDCLTEDMFVLPSASLISRIAFEAVGGFDERLSGYEDDDLFLRILIAGYRNVYVDAPLSMWCIYGTSTTSTPLMTRSRMIYAKKLLSLHGATKSKRATLAKRAIAPRFLRCLVGEYLRAGRRGSQDDMRATLQDVRTILCPHMSPTRRLAVQTALALLENYQIERAIWSPSFLILARTLMEITKTFISNLRMLIRTKKKVFI